MTTYELKIIEDDGTTFTIQTENVDKVVGILSDSQQPQQNLNQGEIIGIIEKWAADNLPPLPPKDVIEKMKDDAANAQKQQTKQTTSLTI